MIKTVIAIALLLLISMTINAQTEEVSFKKTLKVEGRIMYDFNFLSAGDNYSYAGNELRRVRMAIKGDVSRNVSYKTEFDFAGGAVNFRDVYLMYKMYKNGDLILGSFTEPSSLDNMTSSKYITFFERSMMSNTQPFKYNAGIMYDNQNFLDGKLGIQLAYTFSGDKGAAFIDESIAEGANFIARVTTNLMNDKEKSQIVHLGINYEHRDNDTDSYGYKFRDENHMGKKTAVKNLAGNFENTSDIGFELATTFGSLSVQGEFEMASINTDDKDYKTAGYYAFVSYFVTGEHRPYKNSSFGRVKPKTTFGKDRGIGAIELVARYSVMDLNDTYDVAGTDDKNYSISNLTLGVNWHLNKYARFMYNFTSGNHNDMQVEENGSMVQIYGGDALVGHLLRFQIDF